MTATTRTSELSGRLHSLDVLRGFDMFWIIGGAEVVMAVANLFGPQIGIPVTTQLTHAEWIGFRFYDLIMPLFLFIVGAVMPFSLGKRHREAGGRRLVLQRIGRRVLILYLLGFLVAGGLQHLEWVRLNFFNNTLQAIAAGYLVASLCVLFCSVPVQSGIFAALLLSYWALLMFVPGPDFPAGVLEPHRNIAILVDKMVMGVHQHHSTYSWILSSLTFSASVLSGVFAGHLLARKDSARAKIGKLAAAGFGMVGAGWWWGKYDFPVIKHIWTSSLVLYAGGWCFLITALLYLLVDHWGIRKPFEFFRIIGLNAIFAYVVWNIVGIRLLPRIFFSFLQPVFLWNVFAGEFLLAVLNFLSFWTMLYLLYRKRIFIKV